MNKLGRAEITQRKPNGFTIFKYTILYQTYHILHISTLCEHQMCQKWFFDQKRVLRIKMSLIRQPIRIADFGFGALEWKNGCFRPITLIWFSYTWVFARQYLAVSFKIIENQFIFMYFQVFSCFMSPNSALIWHVLIWSRLSNNFYFSLLALSKIVSWVRTPQNTSQKWLQCDWSPWP